MKKGFVNIMKKTILIIIVIIIFIDTICICNFDFSSQRGNSIYKLIFQGSISGIVTFGGLLFTFFRQEQIARCPSIIFEQLGHSHVRTAYENIDKENCIDCCTNIPEYARKVDIYVINVKDSWAVNCSISGVVQGAIPGHDPVKRTLILPSVEQEAICEKIILTFQDACGKKYNQIIECTQSGSKYIFVSKQPKE